MVCGTSNLHFCSECGERKREICFTYQVVKKETVKKKLVELKDLNAGVYKPVEIIEDEKMRVLKVEDEEGEFHFVDQRHYLLEKQALLFSVVRYDYFKLSEEEKEEKAKEIDLLSLLKFFKREGGLPVTTEWEIDRLSLLLKRIFPDSKKWKK